MVQSRFERRRYCFTLAGSQRIYKTLSSASNFPGPQLARTFLTVASSTFRSFIVTYWNAFVANLELQGQGNFFDARLNNSAQYPIAASAGFGNKRTANDMVTSKLAALQFYQLAIPAPTPPEGSFNPDAATRGQSVFNGKAKCAQCHVPPLFTEPGWNAHKPAEIGIDDFQANRSPDKSYRTAPLRGLFAHTKGGFYHDGRFATLNDVVNHYDRHFSLGLTVQEKTELVEYLKSL